MVFNYSGSIMCMGGFIGVGSVVRDLNTRRADMSAVDKLQTVYVFRAVKSEGT